MGMTFDFSFLFSALRPANEGLEDERRCLGIRKDGSLTGPGLRGNVRKLSATVHDISRKSCTIAESLHNSCIFSVSIRRAGAHCRTGTERSALISAFHENAQI
jgi:hypothetical protein